ncbi:MAG: hypothetical protein HUU15_19180, partial [Candidatus Brocadiae bacterium]|nr:hypothetical protein [Candidatus Brocadiia bacterium]
MRIQATLAALLVSALPLLADKVILKDGRKFEGRILHHDAREVKIDLGKNGAAVTFPMDMVERVERSAGSPEQLYEARLLVTDRTSADSLCILADWCSANKLPARAVEHYLEAAALNNAHPRARGRLTELGYKEVDGKWLSREERELLENPPPEVIKPDPDAGPTSEDVARARAKSVVTVWSRRLKDQPGVGVWAQAEGLMWVAGGPAASPDGGEIDMGDRRVPARLLVRDRTRGIALWKADLEGLPAARVSFARLPEKEPLVALAPGGIVANVFPRGWQKSGSEAWMIRIEGPAGGVAIFNLQSELVAISGDGRNAISALDLVRLSNMRPPAPEGVQNAGAAYWRATDLADAEALQMIRSGSRLDRFDPGLGLDEMNRAGELSNDLVRLAALLSSGVDDHVTALKLARHLARGGRISFGLASSSILVGQAQAIFSSIPSMSPVELARLRAALDGLGPDPAGLEASVSGEVTRTEGIVVATHDIRSRNDLAMAVLPLLPPESAEGAEDVAAALEPLLAGQRQFATEVRAACSRPEPARREAIDAIGAGPAALAQF